MALSEAEKEEIRRLHERGLTLAEIARVTDRHWQTVRKYLVRAGLLKTVAAVLCLAALCPATFQSRWSVPCYVMKCLAGTNPVPCARGDYIITRAQATWREGPVTARIVDCSRKPLPHGEVQVFGRVIASGNTAPPYWVTLWDGAMGKQGKLGLLIFTSFPTHFKPGLFIGMTCVLRHEKVADADGVILVLDYRE